MVAPKPSPLVSTFRRIIFAALLSTGCQVHAALLIHEGFNGYTAGSGFAAGTTPNANTTGLDTSTNFGGSGHANLTYSESGLTFGNLATSGGSMRFGTTTSVLSARSSLTSSFTGTLYSSFLINFSAKGTSASHGFVTRISDNINDDTGSRLNSFADSRSGSSLNAGIAYGSAYGSPTLNASTGLITDTTYIVISSFTNIGGNLATSNGTGTLYALTLSQFAAMTASSNWEGYLNDTPVGTEADQISVRVSRNATTGTPTLGADADDFFQVVTSGNSGAFDELRYGSTLEAVVPLIPEPSSALLASLGAFGFLHRRRR
ncbi:MAG: PEP-CTERM sorting domain-containing protein [Akkermansiaceae bacterium]|nr:PEP-CTERM sorting domain-containing protein [Akkermansiaceae bacterium]